jgi:hypothetical protein
MIDAYAVINHGFERGDVVDVLNNVADCNRVDHCMDDIVYEEYTHYIMKYTEEIQDRQDRVYIYYIHGFGNQVRGDHSGEPVDIILGYGLGGNVKDSITCRESRINHFGSLYKQNAPGYVPTMTGTVAIGKGGGKYAARSRNNMNQYFRLHNYDIYVESMQIEITQRIRANHWADMAMILSVILEEISVDQIYDKSLYVFDEV